MKRYRLLIITAIVFIAFSCKKDSSLEVEDIPGLGGDTWTQTSIDKWIYDSLTKPFNIAVKYKWDPHEVSDNFILRDFVPPKEEVVIPLLTSIKKVWADPYITSKDSLFFKQYAPKFFTLFGSAIYNTSNGTKVLGIAEGGKKINLLEINTFKVKQMAGYTAAKDSFQAKEVFHTTHHEAAHILHQTVLYPLEFKRINVGMYTTNWVNDTDSTANQDGFITAYSKADPNEDFVEMVSMMLIEGKAGFEATLNKINKPSVIGTTPAQARDKLHQKEQIVVNYFKTVWNIDFYALQTRVRASVEFYIR